MGDGAKTRFWEDPWTQNSSLMIQFPTLYSLSSQQNVLISNMGWFEGTIWKWTLVWAKELSQEESLQLNELLSLLSQHYPQQNQDDTLLWKDDTKFTVKDLQQSITMDVAIDNLVCTVWMNLAPPKVEFFMWLALLGKLNTKQRLNGRGILKDNQNACTFCAMEPETLDHLLLTCPKSMSIWTSVANELDQHLSFPDTFSQHFEKWMTLKWKSKNQQEDLVINFLCSSLEYLVNEE